MLKKHVTLTGLLVVLLSALALVPAFAGYLIFLHGALIATGLYLVLKVARITEPRAGAAAAEDAPVAEPAPVADKSEPEKSEPEKSVSDAAAITLLGVFQERGRLVDFLMDDITAYSDAQVGSAARVVHQGCAAALREHVPVVPVSGESEGASITVSAEAAGETHRLIGRVAGEPPFTGTLVHQGWQPQEVKLPRVIGVGTSRLPVIAPAQVELK